LIAFYIISSYLDKSSFGEINWALAVLLAAFNILSCGIDNVSIRKIASGADAKSLLSINLWHVLFSGTLFYGLLFASQLIFPGFLRQYHLLLLFADILFNTVQAGCHWHGEIPAGDDNVNLFNGYKGCGTPSLGFVA